MRTTFFSFTFLLFFIFSLCAESRQTIIDSDGDVCSVIVSGSGAAAISLDDPDQDGRGPIKKVELRRTNASSVLTISVAKRLEGDGRITIGAISGDVVATVNAPQCDFTGSGISLAGVSALRIGNLSAGANITLAFRPRVTSLSVVARVVSAIEITAPSSTLSFSAYKVEGASFFARQIASFNIVNGGCSARILTSGRLVSLAVKNGDFKGEIFAQTIGAIRIIKNGAGVGGSLLNSVITARSIGALILDGDLLNSLVLAGANLGADEKIGGVGAAADAFSPGKIGSILILGNLLNSVIGAGFDPANGKFGDSDDGAVGGRESTINTFAVKGRLDNQSFIGAGELPDYVSVNKTEFRPEYDSHFTSRVLGSGANFKTITLITPAGVSAKFATLAMAKENADSGDTIVVGPGIYPVTGNLAIVGGSLTYILSAGATLSLNSSTLQMFDDEGVGTTLTVSGYGSVAITTDSSAAVVRITHQDSVFNFTLHSVLFTNKGSIQGFVVNQHDGTWLGAIDEILVTGRGGTPTVLYWQKGPHFTRCQRIVSSSGYLVWAEPSGTLASEVNGEMFVDCPFISGGADGLPSVFAGNGGGGGGANSSASVWIDTKRVINPIPGRPGDGNGCAIYCAGPKLYISGRPKITGSIGVSAGILYIDAEKQDLSDFDATQTHPTDAMITLLGGESHISIQQVVDTNLEPSGTTVVSSGGNHYLEFRNHIRTVPGFGISHLAGSLKFAGEMNAVVGDFNPIWVSGNGLILESGTVIVAATSRNSISADSPQNVIAYGVSANTPVSSNILVSPNGGLVVDSNIP